MRELTLSQLLEGFTSESRLEEMLSLMSNDNNIMGISIGNNQLYKEVVPEGEIQPLITPILHWDLTDQELAHFTNRMVDILEVRLDKDLTGSNYLSIWLKDAKFDIITPPFSLKYGINCRKIIPITQ